MNTFTATEQQLLELIQTHFPCASRPYQRLAERLGASEQEVLTLLHTFKKRGILRQISAIFDAQALGFRSTLAAFQIEDHRVDAAAEIINAHPGVSHNYQRDHTFNLWFTLSVPCDLDLTEHLTQLARKTSCSHFLNLPALRMFKRQVHLRFTQQQSFLPVLEPPEPRMQDAQGLTDFLSAEIQRRLMRELQQDLPLSPTPFYDIATRCDVKEETVLKFLTVLQASQKMRRFAAILKHGKAGFSANVMVVWNIPNQAIQRFTEYAVTHEAVSHCYERLTTPAWPYNIYTMIHGKTRDETEQILADVSARCDEAVEYQALYTVKEYKKQRVDYFSEDFYEWEKQHHESMQQGKND